MGDRANVYVHEGDAPGVYLYTHNGGSGLPDTVRTALAREQRWHDDPYLARIIFSTMIEGDVSGETGYGISAVPFSGGLIDVDVATQQVTVLGESPQSFRDFIS